MQCKGDAGNFDVVLRPRLWGDTGCIRLHIAAAACATHVQAIGSATVSNRSPVKLPADAPSSPDLLDLALRLSRKFASRCDAWELCVACCCSEMLEVLVLYARLTQLQGMWAVPVNKKCLPRLAQDCCFSQR